MIEVTNTWYRVSVKALIYNETGDLLLCKEDNDMRDLPGGGLNRGEEPHECLHRELFEEMGLRVTSISLAPSCFVALEKATSTRRPWIANICYEVKVEHLLFTPSDECVEIGFFNKDTIKEMSVYGNVSKIMNNV